MTAERSHRFVLTGYDPGGRNRTIICGGRRIWWAAPWCARWW